MSEAREACALCGLDIETEVVLRLREGGTVKFCCEGCLGIYRLVNDVEEAETHPRAEAAQ